MATLPRTAKQTSASASIPTFDHRPRSDPDFDVGINASAAWTGHLDRGSLSDDEPADDDPALREEKGLRARALYQFEGKAEFRELTVEAGDVLDILKEDIGDGWSLVRTAGGEIGLLPTTYYTVCGGAQLWRMFLSDILTSHNSVHDKLSFCAFR
jgi:sorting nexin-9/18/33